MPAYLEENDVATVKIVNSHPENRKKGLPTVMATIILIDPQTGVTKAIMAGARITALRTGAAGAIAAKYLSKSNPKIIGIVGAGTQARTQLMGLQAVFEDIQEVRVFDLNKTAALNYANEMKENNDRVDILPLRKVRDTVQGADIIVTTTPSRKPLVYADWVDVGTHINCIGADAPGKQELDPALLLKSKIIVDDWEQSCHGGEINVPFTKGIIKKEDVWGDICEIVTGLKVGRTSSEEITVFASTGLAIQDAATANIAYEKALKEKVGRYIKLF